MTTLEAGCNNVIIYSSRNSISTCTHNNTGRNARILRTGKKKKNLCAVAAGDHSETAAHCLFGCLAPCLASLLPAWLSAWLLAAWLQGCLPGFLAA
jgi:hypothetical protein